MSDDHNNNDELKKEIEKLKKLAQQGNAKAQFNLGLAYYNGNGVKQDYKQAFYWWGKSADNGKGNAEVQYFGVSLLLWSRVKQDYKQAIEWYTKSANQGNADAQYYLGAAYYKGRGVKQDIIKQLNCGKIWLNKAMPSSI